MATTLSSVEIELVANLVKYKLGLENANKETTRQTRKMSQDFRDQSEKARDSLDLIGNAIGINLPRELKKVIAVIPGVGAALATAFNSVVVIALISVLVEIYRKFGEIREAAKKTAEAQGKVTDQFREMGRESDKALIEAHAKLIRLNEGPLAEMKFRIASINDELEIATRLFQNLKLDEKVSALSGNLLDNLGDAKEKLEAFVPKLKELLNVQGDLKGAQAAVAAELAKQSGEYERLKRLQAAGGIGSGPVEGLRLYLEYLTQISTEVGKGISLEETLKKIREKEFNNEKLDERNKLLKQQNDEWNKEVDTVKSLQGETDNLLGKELSQSEREILAIQGTIQKWEEYKAAWEDAHGGISTIANENVKQLTAEIEHLKAEADAAINTALQAAALNDKSLQEIFKNPTMPVYTGGTQAAEMENIKTNQQEAQNEADRLKDSIQSVNEKLKEQIAVLDELKAQGRLTQEEYDKLKKKAEEAATGMSASWKTLGQHIGDTIKQAALFGRSWTDALKAILIELVQVILQMTVLKNLKSGGGGIGGFFGGLLGGLLGGKRADGGPVAANATYLVGERGPELFAPGVSGSIIPNSGSSGVQVIYQIDARGADISVEQRIRRAIAESESRAVTRAVTTVREVNRRTTR